jgi:hypothetical protein
MWLLFVLHRAGEARPPLPPTAAPSAGFLENPRSSAGRFFPPIRPALAASSGLAAKARFSGGTAFPPMGEISRLCSRLIAAKPCFSFFGNLLVMNSADQNRQRTQKAKHPRRFIRGPTRFLARRGRAPLFSYLKDEGHGERVAHLYA